jgi:hypothetical protein
MAERPPTTPKRDTQDQGEQAGMRWAQWFTSKKNCSLLVLVIQQLMSTFKFLTIQTGQATEEDWTELVQRIYNLYPLCFLELLLSVLDLLSVLPMFPVKFAAVTSKFAADYIMSTFEWKWETCATLFPVLLAILFLAVFVFLTTQLWLAFAPRHTKTDTLKYQQMFASLRNKIMFYTFVIVLLINRFGNRIHLFYIIRLCREN